MVLVKEGVLIPGGDILNTGRGWNRRMNMMALCHKCKSGKVKALVRIGAKLIMGCKALTQADWKAGWKRGNGGFYTQRNCPIFKRDPPKVLNGNE